MLSCCPPALIPLRSLRLTLHLALLAFLCPLVAEEFSSDVTTEVKPWTHLNFANDPDDFQFAIVGDHTGGPRAGVFDDAVQKLNQLMPEFVINVGDCIKGNTENADTNAEEWDHFTAMTAKLKMPFFVVPGNHDIQMKWLPGRVQPEEMMEQWQARFGPTHYSFVYKNVLFVVLFSNDGMSVRREQHISEEQATYFEETMRAFPNVRRTFVLLHHPLWAYPHESNFSRIESALAGRKYTVIAGHQHRYMHVERNGTDYYVLATTGGSSPLRGNAFGELDHVTWVTMKDEGPVLANLRLDGILPHDLFTPEKAAAVRALGASATVDVSALIDGTPEIKGGSVFLALRNVSPRPLRLEGEFRYHPHVHPLPGRIERTVEPHTREVLEVALDVVQLFEGSDGPPLEFAGSFRFADDPADSGLSLPAKLTIPLKSAGTDVWGTEYQEFVGSTTLTPRYDRDEREVRLTSDGTDPTRTSSLFDRPRTVSDSTTLKARFFTRDGLAGPVSTLTLKKIPAGPGLLCHYYEHEAAEGNVKSMPYFVGLPPTYTRRVSNFDVNAVIRKDENFALVFYGWFDATESGEHTFHLTSADGARLYVGGQLVVDDPIKHPRREAAGALHLDRGRHAIEVHYFKAARSDGILRVEFTSPSGERQLVPDRALSIDERAAPILKARSVEVLD